MAAAPSTPWIAYADGSCLGNPGPGGWGVVVIDPDGATHEYSGVDPSTTNNRMEIAAAIEALRAIPAGADVRLHSDSQYVIKTMTLGWKRRENLDLWRLLDHEASQRRVQWEWVRGHSGDRYNERADELARSAAEGRAPCAVLAPATADNAIDITAELGPLLHAGEEIHRCAACGRDFVGLKGDRFCSLAECQLKTRRAHDKAKA
jgi:ribonuclease HI